MVPLLLLCLDIVFDLVQFSSSGIKCVSDMVDLQYRWGLEFGSLIQHIYLDHVDARLLIDIILRQIIAGGFNGIFAFSFVNRTGGNTEIARLGIEA